MLNFKYMFNIISLSDAIACSMCYCVDSHYLQLLVLRNSGSFQCSIMRPSVWKKQQMA